MEEDIVATSGTWSEVSREKEVREEEGNIVLAALLKKNLSSLTKVGDERRLDQVY